MKGIGLFTRLYNVESTNNLITNCGGYCMALTWGGNYNFKHATLANYWPYSVRNTPSLFLNNFTLDTLDNPIPFAMNFEIANSIKDKDMKLIHAFTKGNFRECNKLMFTIFEICEYYDENEPGKVNYGKLSKRIIEMAAIKLGYIDV